MKFIFPQNYSFCEKLLGFIDYSTVFLNGIWAFCVYLISRIFSFNITLQITLFIILFLPVCLFSIFCSNNEKITYVLKYLYAYIKSPKYYIYKKY